MKCPKCGGKSRVTNSIVDTEDNETYRKLKCNICNHIFYTIEFEVEFNDAYQERYQKLTRAYYGEAHRRYLKRNKEKTNGSAFKNSL